MHSVMADQGASNVLREYRKGNWTVHETLVLISAKKMDEERRMKRGGDSGEGRSRPAELRWKWVEDYCWRHGCLRSQNQCNDKWDNLMRDYKKVRDYERRLAESGDGEENSYWKLEKHDRKERNLPSNMVMEIYDALVEVVEKRGVQRVSAGSASNTSALAVDKAMASVQPSLPPLLQYHSSDPTPTPTLPLPPAPPPPPPPTLPQSQPLPTLDSDTSEHSQSQAKRRRRGEGTSSASNNSHEVGSAISKSASIIAEALQACEEKEERRHRDLLTMQERRLKIEESRIEINREAINGLVDAINKLSSSILALVSNRTPAAPK
ncbi:PREDICTED: trihelix transcription factor ASR3-like isoform X2 [Nelumbo nucifera]|uniref:Trihelix transcription factor ASR3-like isoform X2 n=1 Tax=Nelumbo nucifera TaxID=4432 RepID=A0A1U8AWA3_NELNU|nr:PREDICTED: trihelix transcription factor ASR3-like isoform X2 [Nelumbo nucifera]